MRVPPLNADTDIFRSEALANTIPVARNAPQSPAHGLYTEKLSGTAFTVPRADNQHTWLYRILPSSAHANFAPFHTAHEKNNANLNGDGDQSLSTAENKLVFNPDQLLFDPFDIDESADWITGSRMVAGSGDPTTKTGLAIHIISAGKDMSAKQAFYCSDGDLLIVLQHGVLDIQTELGKLLIRPNEIVVIPRGIRHRVTLPAGPVRCFALELYQGHFKLPELGFIGSNGLANARDFQVPLAHYEEDYESEWSVVTRYNSQLFELRQGHTPFDVVAWHGLYYPYKYDLDRFNAIGSVSYDHIDPSIYTVLTAPSDTPGVAVADFVIFPPRWSVQENTFRPPWYHRNTMGEFSSMIEANIDLGKSSGLKPAGATLHNIMSGHGPDANVAEKARQEELKPVKEGVAVKAFMFETSYMLGVTDWALYQSGKVRPSYKEDKWQPLKVHFTKQA